MLLFLLGCYFVSIGIKPDAGQKRMSNALFTHRYEIENCGNGSAVTLGGATQLTFGDAGDCR